MTVVWCTRSKAFLKSMKARATDVFRCSKCLFVKSRRLIKQCVVEVDDVAVLLWVYEGGKVGVCPLEDEGFAQEGGDGRNRDESEVTQ